MEEFHLPKGQALWLTVGAFFFITFIVYYQSLWNPFVRWDDGLLIYENPAIHAITPATLWKIFTSYDPELYIPLTFFSYQLNYLVSGINPVMYHFSNLVLHTMNALLVAWLFCVLGIRRSTAVLLGLLFAVHPLHTEAVAWASARKDVLSTFFCLISLNLFLYWKQRRQSKWYKWSIGFFLCALLSKVVVAVLPGILFLYLYLTESRAVKSWFTQLVPYIGLSILFIIVALIGKQSALSSASVLELTLMACKSTVFYIQKLFVPTNLSVLYPFTDSVTVAVFLVPLLLTCGLLLAMVWGLVQKKFALGLGLGIFFLTVLPTFTNAYKGGDFYFASDRYAYMPSIGVLLLIGFLLDKYRPATVVQSVVAVLVLSCFGWMSHAQAKVWSSNDRLFEHAATLYPNSHVAHNNIGNSLYRIGEFAKAVESYDKALTIRDHHRTRSNYAAVLHKQGKSDEALQEYNRVLETNPNAKEAHFGLGVLHAAQGNYDQAIASYTRTLELDSSYAEVHINFGALYMQLGNIDSALEQYDKALYILPFSAQAHYNRAIALRKLKRTKEAITAYEKAVDIQPSFIAARINLGILYHERRNIAGAIQQFEAVLRYDPSNASAKQALQQLR